MSTISTIVNSFSISSEAKKFICDNHIDHNVVSAYETISHDDCDEEGPKSNLHDLFVTIQEGESYTYHYYHRENWFYGKPEEQTYYLEETAYSSVLFEMVDMGWWAYYFKY